MALTRGILARPTQSSWSFWRIGFQGGRPYKWQTLEHTSAQEIMKMVYPARHQRQTQWEHFALPFVFRRVQSGQPGDGPTLITGTTGNNIG